MPPFPWGLSKDPDNHPKNLDVLEEIVWAGFTDEDDADTEGDTDTDTELEFDSEEEDEKAPCSIEIYPEGGLPQPDGTVTLAANIQVLHDAINAHGKIHGYTVNRRSASNYKDG